METGSKELLLSQDQKSIGMEPHRTNMGLNQFLEAGDHYEQVNSQANIQIKYYLEFKKIYLTAFKLRTELHKQTHIKETLTSRISTIETQLTALHKVRRHEEESQVPEDPDNDSKRRGSKRQRRTAEQIERKYNCIAEFCGRCYGSEGSLQQHIKLKHPQIYKKEVELDQF